MTTDERTKGGEAIVRVCRRLYERGLIAGPEGNISIRLPDSSILVTPAGWSKVDLTPDDLVLVDRSGKVLAGRGKPSSELGMHLRIYECRPEINAVVHAHPPTATGFALAGEGFVAPVLPEVILQIGEIPLVPYAAPGTGAVADSIEPYVRAGYNAFLMANHGATALGGVLDVAHQRMESMEHAARILLTARLLGRVNELTVADVRELGAEGGGAEGHARNND